MKIAINHRKNSFSERWIKYCIDNSLSYKLVDVYSNDIIEQISDCNIFMWHHSNYDYRDALFAKQLMFSIQKKGIKVFPDFNTNWHFDDKVGQKYLLEAVGAPLVPSYVFYTKKDALSWIENATFPKVFKLRGGSGSSNVKLVNNKKEANKLITKAFSNGFSQFDKLTHLKYRIGNFKAGKEGFSAILKGAARLFIGSDYSNQYPKEKGYIYFQEFIPNNKTDFRVKIVASKCWAFQRGVRENDFRASGSGEVIYNNNQIPLEMIKIAYDVYNKLNLQSVAFDFVLQEGKPLIVEISYGFGLDKKELDLGYWDKSLNWHKGTFNPFGWMIENML